MEHARGTRPTPVFCIQQARARKDHLRFRIGTANLSVACFNKIVTVHLYSFYDRHRSWSSHPGTITGGALGRCQAQLRAEGDLEEGQGK